MKLNKLLILWQKNNLITKEQSENIASFMKERQKEQFFRFVKWFFIIGAFWLVFGLIALIINFFELDFMERITKFILSVINAIVTPIYNLLEYLFHDNYVYFLAGLGSLALSFLFIYFAKKKTIDKNFDKLNLTLEQKQILSGKLVWETISCIFLAGFFMFFNRLIISSNCDYYNCAAKIFPFWHLIGAITFITIAYKLKRVMYLIFGLYFIMLFSGMFSGYGYACYWIGASRPVVQLLIGIILILIGYVSELKLELNPSEEEENLDIKELKEKFAQTYSWAGLLTGFIALWIISFWGFDLDYSKYHSSASDAELWIANILFIACSILSMYWGAKNEKKLFFNYGLTFLIIETYTLFLSRLWGDLPFALASLILGAMMITTGKLIVKIYVKKCT